MNYRNNPLRKSLLRRQVLSWFLMILAVMALAVGIEILIGQKLFSEYDLLLQDNAACYDAQEAIEQESDAFEDYVREASQQNLQNYQNACAATRACLDALPFDYGQIGEERYARTWNLVHGYEGYAQYRDAFFELDPASEDYVEEMYRVIQMQDHLSGYALRLVQVTLEESNRLYGVRASLFQMMPVFFGFLLFATLAATAAILRHLSKTVVLPLVRMAQASRKITENDFSGEDLPVESGGEVSELTASFNRMKHAMHEHIATLEVLHQEELAKLELEKNLDHTRLEMLKSQVDPHFLFNTLNMISCMARLEDAGTTDKMIVSLGNLFRYNLRTKEQEVYLEQELEALDDYIYIQQMRFDSRITCKKMIHVDPWQVKIPSFSLQPLVENAFSHGLNAREEGGRILVRIWQEGEKLIVSIADNGRGMNSAELSALNRSMLESEQTGKGIGLGNIHRRIAMLYPDGALRIYSREGRGTIIQLIIPQTVNPEGDKK